MSINAELHGFPEESSRERLERAIQTLNQSLKRMSVDAMRLSALLVALTPSLVETFSPSNAYAAEPIHSSQSHLEKEFGDGAFTFVALPGREGEMVHRISSLTGHEDAMSDSFVSSSEYGKSGNAFGSVHFSVDVYENDVVTKEILFRGWMNFPYRGNVEVVFSAQRWVDETGAWKEPGMYIQKRIKVEGMPERSEYISVQMTEDDFHSLFSIIEQVRTYSLREINDQTSSDLSGANGLVDVAIDLNLERQFEDDFRYDENGEWDPFLNREISFGVDKDGKRFAVVDLNFVRDGQDVKQTLFGSENERVQRGANWRALFPEVEVRGAGVKTAIRGGAVAPALSVESLKRKSNLDFGTNHHRVPNNDQLP